MQIIIETWQDAIDRVEVTASGSADGNELLDKLLPKPPKVVSTGSMSMDQTIKLMGFIRNGSKIQAIKLIREVFGLGLKEAKDFCENNYKLNWTPQ